MSQLKVWLICGIAVFTIHAGLWAAWADDHRSNDEAEHHEFSEHHKSHRKTEGHHKEHKDEDDHDDEHHAVFEQNSIYLNTCGGCHSGQILIGIVPTTCCAPVIMIGP